MKASANSRRGREVAKYSITNSHAALVRSRASNHRFVPSQDRYRSIDSAPPSSLSNENNAQPLRIPLESISSSKINVSPVKCTADPTRISADCFNKRDKAPARNDENQNGIVCGVGAWLDEHTHRAEAYSATTARHLASCCERQAVDKQGPHTGVSDHIMSQHVALDQLHEDKGSSLLD